jgi:phosphoribosyl-ATP pyrophosphohydrolase/phosphoribosyl-AMP cyclohydrolase
VETVIEAMDNNNELFLYESADLLFHAITSKRFYFKRFSRRINRKAKVK